MVTINCVKLTSFHKSRIRKKQVEHTWNRLNLSPFLRGRKLISNRRTHVLWKINIPSPSPRVNQYKFSSQMCPPPTRGRTKDLRTRERRIKRSWARSSYLSYSFLRPGDRRLHSGRAPPPSFPPSTCLKRQQICQNLGFRAQSIPRSLFITVIAPSPWIASGCNLCRRISGGLDLKYN